LPHYGARGGVGLERCTPDAPPDAPLYPIDIYTFYILGYKGGVGIGVKDYKRLTEQKAKILKPF